jgi:hypothetical protein
MGHAANRRFDRIADAKKHDGDIIVTCSNWRCRHELGIEYETFRAILRELRLSDDLARLGHAMRCHRCGHRWPKFSLTAKGDRRTLALKDGDPLPPKGVPLWKWLKADNGERHRLRRLIRG